MAVQSPPAQLAPDGPSAAQRPAPRPGRLHRVLVLAVALLGIGVLLYPTAASWFSDRVHDAAVTGYVEDVEQLPLPEKRAQLKSALEYNANLPGAPLGDPYGSGSAMDAHAAGVADYLNELDATPVMARVRIPAIGVDLPIYHGTSAQTLSRGIGHLFGSSLPVGGPDTHAVLTGHSGFVRATLFDYLHEVEEGDTFTISVLDEVLVYEVDQILVVDPEDTDTLRIYPGEDYVTLVTCTPIGVNSHRLLVRGERVENPESSDPAATVPGTGQSAGFPWWVFVLLAVPTAFAVGMRARRGRPAGVARSAHRTGRSRGPRHGRRRGRGHRHG